MIYEPAVTTATMKGHAMPVSSPSEFGAAFQKGFEDADAAAVLDLYADDIVAVPEPGARLNGKAELEAGLGAFFAMAPSKLTFDPAVVEGENTAIVYGDWTFDGTSAEGPVHIEARATVVLAKRDGAWYAVVDDFFSQA